MRWCVRGLLLAVTGCAAPAARPAAPAEPPSPPRHAAASDVAVGSPARPASSRPPPIRWANITTVENCFYFSAPFDGRDDQLRGVAELVLAAGSASAVQLRLGTTMFEGTLDGELLDVTRSSTHEHEGTWTVTESIVGTYRDGELRARYRYAECGTEGCPGRCTMTADLAGSVTVRTR